MLHERAATSRASASCCTRRGWRSAASRREVSNPEVDEIYQSALGGRRARRQAARRRRRRLPAAVRAARIATSALRRSSRRLIHVPFRFESAGSQIIFYDPETEYRRRGARARKRSAPGCSASAAAPERWPRGQRTRASSSRAAARCVGARSWRDGCASRLREPRRRRRRRARPARRRSGRRRSSPSERPEYVFLLGGRSGGIARNQREPADADARQPARRDAHVIPAAHRHGVAQAALPRGSLHLPARVRAADASRAAR